MSVYFVQSIDGGPIKIGYSFDVVSRLEQLERHYGKPLAILATMPGGRAEETAIHRRFAHLRCGKTEQFRPAPELMSFINRPLLVNQGDVALMEPAPDSATATVIAHLKGTQAYADWLDAVHRKTLIPRTAIIRRAVAEWAKRNGHPEPPEF